MPILPAKSLIKKRIEKSNEQTSERVMHREAFKFQENTKFSRDTSVADFTHIANIREDRDRVHVMTEHFKEYEGVKTIPLPHIESIPKSGCSFEEVILKRRSSRDFNSRSISFNSLAGILQLAYGITGKIPYDIGKNLLLRAAPSGGALYPLELYPIIFCVDKMEPGIYHYNVKKNILEFLKTGDFREECYRISNDQDILKQASLLVLITAVMERTLYKYRERGLRFIYIDAGHMAQNMHLAATNENLGACALGGLYDRDAEKLLEVDGFYESMVYGMVIGGK